MKILVTGSAGFIGFHLCKKLLKNNKDKICGIDNLNSYYDKNLKISRLKNLRNINFIFRKIDITNYNSLKKLFKKKKFDIVYHLAAQAGVRFSIINPKAYFDSNLKGFFNILEVCKEYKVKHLIFASTSSVYGMQNKFPLEESFSTDKPLSFYAATKKCNEIMAYSYSHIYKLKCTAVRFFTVFGPFGRPDMALYKFAESIKCNKKIYLYNYGKHSRDFTYIDDVIYYLFKIKNSQSNDKFEIYNICSNYSVKLIKYLSYIKKFFINKPKIKKIGLQKGDVIKTHGSNSKVKKNFGKIAFTKVEDGVNHFMNWFLRK